MPPAEPEQHTDVQRHSPRITSAQDLATLYAVKPIEVRVSRGLTDYPEAVQFMEDRAAAIHAGTAAECLWLVEHPPLYTAGTSARPDDLRDKDRFPVYRSARGGQYTYHGPGQRVAYVMLDLTRRGRDVRRFVQGLEAWLIATLAAFNIDGETRDGRVGVWVRRAGPAPSSGEDKIAAIGVRIRRWVSFHGIALNIEPELNHFTGIVPCGIAEDGLGVTSLVNLGRPVTMDEVDAVLINEFAALFGPVSNH